MKLIKVLVKLDKNEAALEMADRGIPFAFLFEGRGEDGKLETVGLVSSDFADLVKEWDQARILIG